MKDVNIYIYTEYSGSMKCGTGKYHVILESYVKTKTGEDPATLKEIKVLEDITRNRLELMAADNALSHLSKRSRVIIHTTSEYVTNAFMNGWPEKWERTGYKRKGKDIKHADLWRSIMKKMELHDVTFMKASTTPYMRAQAIELKNFKEEMNTRC